MHSKIHYRRTKLMHPILPDPSPPVNTVKFSRYDSVARSDESHLDVTLLLTPCYPFIPNSL